MLTFIQRFICTGLETYFFRLHIPCSSYKFSCVHTFCLDHYAWTISFFISMFYLWSASMCLLDAFCISRDSKILFSFFLDQFFLKMFNLAFFSKTLQKLQFLHNFMELLDVQINSRPLLFIDYKTYSNWNFFSVI